MIEIRLHQPAEKDSIPVYTDIRKLSAYSSDVSKYYYIPFLPILPEWTNKNYNYKGYKINLFKLTCNCEDSSNKRTLYSHGDVRGICKHIYYKITSMKIMNQIPELSLILLKNAVIFEDVFFYKVPIDKKDFYFAFNLESQWINITAINPNSNNNNYYNYTFHPIQNKWKSQAIAQPKEKVIYMLNQLIKFDLPYKHKYIDFEELKKTW